MQRRTVKEGVTTSSEIVVRWANGESFERKFEEDIHEGVEFRVIKQRPGWYEIELPDGKTGWIKQSHAEII